MDKILHIENLTVEFDQPGSKVRAVDDISFELKEGQSLGVVGESGSGKSVTSLSILNLLKYQKNNQTTGKIIFSNQDAPSEILDLTERYLSRIRGGMIGLVFQEPMSSLNPVMRCGKQVEEVLKTHDVVEQSAFRDRVISLLEKVRLDDTERIYRSYPHQLSGGQLQRVNIAMALAGEPQILICDEPTTALDVTVQKEVVTLLKDLVSEESLAMIFVCHDLDLVSEICDSVIVMKNGKIVEQGPLPDTFNSPKHSYTKALLQCKPQPSKKTLKLPTIESIIQGGEASKFRPAHTRSEEVVLVVKNLTKTYVQSHVTFFSRPQLFNALSQINFELSQGEILGVVGESGSGKSTLAGCIAGLFPISGGAMKYRSREYDYRTLQTDKSLRRDIQLIFQDPYGSLNPRMTIGRCIAEPILYHRIIESEMEAKTRVIELLERVGLEASHFDRYPHELSGGQRQRVCIARALAVQPKLLICDECVSALDVSVQAQILNLLDELRASLGLSMIFISHDLSVVHYISDRIIVMKDGYMVESGTADEIMFSPSSDYTQALINSIPGSDHF